MIISLDLIAVLLESFAFVFLYLMTGFGPGFVLGMLLANLLLARNQPTYMETHEEAKKRAAQHNAQWAPSNERWHQ